MRKVLKNVLDNAVRFTEEGKVELSIDKVGEKVLVQLKDTGIGIESDKIDVIFEKFRQADDSTIREYSGAGLGLYTAAKMMELMGGEIAVESPITEFQKNSVPQGSKFTIELPL